MSEDPILDRAAAVLARRHGLRFDGVGRGRLARALAEAAAEAGADPTTLADELAARPLAEARLLDHVTLQETSFFRDPGMWTALAGALASGPARRGAATVWSAGCANGQEAWSLVMLLAELGLEHVHVLASDLSPAAVDRTREATYAERELRGLDPGRRRRFMEPCAEGFRVRPELRARLEATAHNAARERILAGDASCAAVLCRYVLIYLEADGAEQLLAEAERVLAPGGRLVIGAAESLWHLTDRWRAEPFGDSAAYVPAGAEPRATRPIRARGRALPPAPRATRRPLPATPPPPADELHVLRARGEAAMARGDHAAAEAAYRGAAYLAPGDPLAHLGLGLALEAAGDPGARRAFSAAWTALGDDGGSELGDALEGYAPEDLARLLAGKLAEAGG